jgi:lysosomal Pro-X carboxypeptidase
MISSWMRMKFPNVITGALAASAPILHFKGATNPNEFTTIASKVINETGG